MNLLLISFIGLYSLVSLRRHTSSCLIYGMHIFFLTMLSYILCTHTMESHLVSWLHLALGLSLFGCMLLMFTLKDTTYHALFLISAYGALWVIESDHFLSLYVGLELHTLPLYFIYNKLYKKENNTLHFFFIQSLASLFLMVGWILQGYKTGSDSFLLHHQGHMFFLLGVMIKSGLFPFHFWVVKILKDSHWIFLAIIGTLSKIVALKILSFMSLEGWIYGLAVASILATILWGIVGTLTETSVDKILIFSGFIHTGWIMGGYLFSSQISGYYLSVYCPAFLSIILLSYYNFSSYYKKLSAILGAGLWFGMVGLPPFGGFLAKIHVCLAWLKHSHALFLSIALLSSVVGVFYALRVIQQSDFYLNTASKECLTQTRTQDLVLLSILTIYGILTPVYIGFSL